jgi:uncharacterized SAM-binding protein YcdF (DUF218 family)
MLLASIWFKKKSLLIFAMTLLTMTSIPAISNQLTSFLEGNQSKKTLAEIESADAIVVLSGMLTTIQTNHGVEHEWGDPDRFFGGMHLMKSNKASRIIFTGGKLPWENTPMTEGEVLARFAKDGGIPQNNILVTKKVENTNDEAKAVKELLSKSHLNRIILVTSAFHMPRAKRLFEKQGLEVQTYPVDFKADANKTTIMDFIPSAHAMKNFEFATRELFGRIYYQLKDQ